MKKLSILTLGVALGIAGNAAVPVQAASVNDIREQLKKNGYAVIGGSTECLDGVSDILSEVCKELNGLYGKDRPILTLPGTDSNQPDSSAPGTDSDQTDSSAPGTDISQPENDSNSPEGDSSKPESDNNKPGTDVNQPGSDKTENNRPDTDKGERSYAEQVVDLVNAERAKAGLNPLTLDKEIEGAALVRAKEIEISFAHTRPDGRSFSTALKDRGITFKSAGENIAWGQRSPEAVMDAWMNSDGHRANILNPRFTKIGVGYYQNTAGRNYWTQLFTY